MKKESDYHAKLILTNQKSKKKEFEKEGKAEDILIDAMKFIGKKDEKKALHEKILHYIAEDFKVFDRKMNKLFFNKE